jgi:HEAT repeat protein
MGNEKANIKLLEKRLASSNAEERREATIELGRAGNAAVPLLFRAIGDGDWRVRKTAVEAIVAIGDESVVTQLIRTLSAHDNAGARNSAIEALVQIGGPAVKALLSALGTPDPDVRKFIVDILGDLRDPRAAPALISSLDDGDENIRVASAEALGKIRDPQAVDALLTCMARPGQGWLGYAAAEALGAIGDERALGPLLTALGNSSLREPVLESLGKIGNGNTLGPLIHGLADPLRIVREVSSVALVAIYRKSAPPEQQAIILAVRAGMSDRGVDFLEELLVTSSGELQKAAIFLLGWIGRDSSIRKLLSLLKEEELEEPLVQALMHIDTSKATFLLGYLSSDNALVRRTVARVLGDLGVAGAEDSLVSLLRDENGHVRSMAAGALGRLRSRKAINPLLALLTDEYESVQESAIHALAAIGDESMLDGLIKDFSSRDAFLRRNIAVLLGKLRTDKAASALAFALKDEEPEVRKAVVHAFGDMLPGKSLKPLLLAITDDDPEVRMLAAESLGKMKTAEAFNALLPLLEDNDLWVRAAAARGLGRIGGDAAGEILTNRLKNATDIYLLALVEALGKLVFVPAREPLVGLTSHPDPEVRKTVLSALSGYSGEVVQRAVMSRLSDPHWSVRKAAIASLTQKRDAATEALLATIAADDPDPTVRLAAKEALRK